MSESDELLAHGYICDDCAIKKGYTWPKGNYATFHIGECQVCQTDTAVCQLEDWLVNQTKEKSNEK